MPALVRLGIGQSTRGYDPMQVSHYKAAWIQGSDTWSEPTWPLKLGEGDVWDGARLTIAWENDALWCAETGDRTIYRLDPRDGTILDGIEIPAPYPEPHGMTLWGGALWYCDATTRTVCRLRL